MGKFTAICHSDIALGAVGRKNRKLFGVELRGSLKIKKLNILNTLALRLWRDLPTPPVVGEPMMLHVRGNPNSSVLMVTPVPTEDEYENKVPFSNRAAEIFCNILYDAKINPEDFFIIACCRWGEKALTANTQDVRDFVDTAIKKKLFKFVISVGDIPTCWIVNNGKKANMSYFAGKLVYPPNLHHCPLFVFPNIDPLTPERTDNERENYRRKNFAEWLANKIEKQAKELKCHLKKV